MLISALETLLKGSDELKTLDQNVRRYCLRSCSNAHTAFLHHTSLHHIFWHIVDALNQKAKMNRTLFLLLVIATSIRQSE
jgi:hypothetical protein